MPICRLLPGLLVAGLALGQAAPAQAQFIIPASAVTLHMVRNEGCSLAPEQMFAGSPDVLNVTLRNTGNNFVSSFWMVITLQGTNFRGFIHAGTDRLYGPGLMMIPIRTGSVTLPASLANGSATIIVENCTVERRP
ncbi:hypothetical protein [Sediminicoccus sp. BL-A-41-H5]|uniref:hypothetical protein n=1 Tax=Sediminicoccus sp. BL-A-41-H5 TaxID=3421106 RepID=UPI003D677346